MGPLLGLNIIDGTVVVLSTVVSIAFIVFLLVRLHPKFEARSRRMTRVVSRRRWIITVAIAGLSGAFIAVVTLWLTESVFNVFGLPLDPDTRVWVVACFAAIAIAVVNLPRSRWWRRATAIVAVPVFLITATLGINAGYGMNATLAEFLNISDLHPLVVHRAAPAPTSTPTGPPKPLYQSWTAPAGMPTDGSVGSVSIPATVSGFVARPAWLYLPPAALVAHPPALPILIMMMGQPGGPESSYLFPPFLNAFAHAHHGLAPIVLTVDQIGNPYKNPLCIDSPAGNVHSYLMDDVVAYAKTLPVAAGPRNWAVGGYSNGGECALSFGAKHPDIFGSIVDISGEVAPSLGSRAATIQRGFAGNVAAYTAELPLTILAAHHYIDSRAIFTWGGADALYGAEGEQASAAALAAGMVVTHFSGPGVGHRADAVNFGFPLGLSGLATRWSLEESPG